MLVSKGENLLNSSSHDLSIDLKNVYKICISFVWGIVVGNTQWYFGASLALCSGITSSSAQGTICGVGGQMVQQKLGFFLSTLTPVLSL